LAWLAAMLVTSCSYLPAKRECAHVEQQLAGVELVKSTNVECGGGMLAGDGARARVEMHDGAVLILEHLGFNAFGSSATFIVVGEASGLVPRIASCEGVASPNFHREAALGHHFQPTLIDTKEAVSRYRELLEEVEFWPQCPQNWEVEDKRGARFRYCARRKDATEEPPRPGNCLP
jgi:hypothetical protein